MSSDFGQAEVTAPDGSAALVQVRHPGENRLRTGSHAVIYDYDVGAEVFRVAPFDAPADLGLPGSTTR